MQELQKNTFAPLDIFISYAHDDGDLCNELKKHLMPLKREGLITPWHDGQIPPGSEWNREITQHLTTASLILLLISPDFIASEYCYSVEMQEALKRHEEGSVVVIPVLLRHVDWTKTPIGVLQALPSSARPIMKWPDRDEAFENVAKGIREVINKFTSQPRIQQNHQTPQSQIYSSQQNQGNTVAVLSPSNKGKVNSLNFIKQTVDRLIQAEIEEIDQIRCDQSAKMMWVHFTCSDQQREQYCAQLDHIGDKQGWQIRVEQASEEQELFYIAKDLFALLAPDATPKIRDFQTGQRTLHITYTRASQLDEATLTRIKRSFKERTHSSRTLGIEFEMLHYGATSVLYQKKLSEDQAIQLGEKIFSSLPGYRNFQTEKKTFTFQVRFCFPSLIRKNYSINLDSLAKQTGWKIEVYQNTDETALLEEANRCLPTGIVRHKHSFSQKNERLKYFYDGTLTKKEIVESSKKFLAITGWEIELIPK